MERNRIGRGKKMTPRDIARRHWFSLADPEQTLSHETTAWVRAVALRMIAADALPAADRREEVFSASGLKGDAEDGLLAVIFVALRKYERLKVERSKRITGLTAADFVASELEWDTAHEVAPDSHRKRITRALDQLAVDSVSRAWARALIASK